jgi:hypothetical protein
MLIAAGILHLAVTIAIFSAGHYKLSPGTFDKDGIGISFAVDGVQHRTDAVALSEYLRSGALVDWLRAPYPLHDKLYSICFAVLGPWLGFNIITIEPLNVLLYLGILFLVYKLGEEVFSARAGRLAAIVVALWPSFLLHTTQLLRDPLFVLGLLAFVVVVVRLLSREYQWGRALLVATAGGFLTIALGLTRARIGGLAAAIATLAAGMLIAVQFAKRPTQTRNLAGMGLLIAMTFVAQQVLPRHDRTPVIAPSDSTNTQELDRRHDVNTSANSVRGPVSEPTWLVRRISADRTRFMIRYPDAGSNVDQNVALDSFSDIIRYLPRAAVIGFFAPFPNMWFTGGEEVGLIGRLLSGMESVVFYGFEALALFALWSGRRRITLWLLASVAAIGIIALGLVVTNMAALFRLRYGFAVLIIILGAAGAVQVLGDRFQRN